jgi:hypothetical protein
MTTIEIKNQALNILVNSYGMQVSKSMFTVKLAKQVIKEYNFKKERGLI